MHQRGAVDELDRRRRPDEPVPVAARVRAGRQEDEQRAQPLAARRDGLARVLPKDPAVVARKRRQALLDALEEPCEVLAPRLHHRGVGARHGAHGFVPAWIAMMPPAVMR